MAGKVKQALEKEVTCPLCLDLFKEPKKLPCDHVYCKDCLKGLALRSLNQSISCPECRTNTNVPNGNVNDFPTAFRMNRLIAAFQEAQEERDHHGEESTDSPTSCTVHPAQPLALYCETCKTTLCRDCVIMNKDHQKHHYDYVDKVAEKFREKYASRLQMTKEYGELLLHIHTKILKMEDTINSEETLNQEKIHRAFEGLQRTLEESKQSMKRGLSQKYQAAKDSLQPHKHQAESIQAETANVAALVEEVLHCPNDTLIAVEGLIENETTKLQKQIEQFSLVVEETPLLVPEIMSSESLKMHLNESNYMYMLADPTKCRIDGSFLKKANTHQGYVLTMNLVDLKGNKCTTGLQQVKARLRSIRDGTITEGRIELLSPGNVSITFDPQTRGRKQLTVTVRGQHIANSPRSVYVHMPPTQLDKPVAQVMNLDMPTGLTCYGNGILALQSHRNIVKVNSSFENAGPFSRERLSLPSKATTDRQGNVYVTTVQDQVHKFGRDGLHVKSIGAEGKLPGQFNFPNGLRINSKEELYVCDSKNNRIQVFDLNLIFKREFGRPGMGKGHFSFPSDVDFDRNDNVYITDSYNHRIQVFTPREQFVRTIGYKQFGQKELEFPTNLQVVNDLLFVTDVTKRCIVILETSGELVKTFGDGVLEKPEGLAVDEDGYVYVTSHSSKLIVF